MVKDWSIFVVDPNFGFVLCFAIVFLEALIRVYLLSRAVDGFLSATEVLFKVILELKRELTDVKLGTVLDISF